MKLSCTPISMSPSFRDGTMDLERFVGFCAEQELDGVDLMAPGFYAWSWNDAPRELQAAPGWIERAGLQVAAYAAGNNFAKRDETEFRAQVDAVRQCLREAAELGAPVLRIFGGYLERTGGDPGTTLDKGLQGILRGVEACLPDAEQCGVVMALENHGCLPGHSFELLGILEHFNSPYLRCTPDCANFIGNSMDEPEDPLGAVLRLAPWAKHVHMKDVRPAAPDSDRRMDPCVAGEGVTPIRQCAAALERAGFDGYCSLEYEAHRTTPAAEGVPHSLAFLRDVRAALRVLA